MRRLSATALALAAVLVGCGAAGGGAEEVRPADAAGATEGASRSADAQGAAGDAVDGPGEDGFFSDPVVPEVPAPELALTDHTGAAWSMAEQRGRVVVLFFGYTHCPDICPQTLNVARLALAEPDVDASKVAVVLVSVDPERDTPEVLAPYVGAFGPEFTGLTGDPAAVRAVAEGYGVRYEAESPDGPVTPSAGGTYTVAHSPWTLLIDGTGQLRRRFAGAFTPAELANDLRVLGAEMR